VDPSHEGVSGTGAPQGPQVADGSTAASVEALRRWRATAQADQAVLARHHRVWNDKPVLERVYAVWFDALLECVPPGATVLEVGAGPGFLSGHAHRTRSDLRWIATDLLWNPSNDIVADALHLPIRSSTVGAVVGFDVLHHLVRPAAFLREAARALTPGGRLIMIEPWLTPLSYAVYRWAHHESCDRNVDPWAPFAADDSGGKEAFEGNSAVPWKLIRATTAHDWEQLGLESPRLRVFNGFAYLLSLGFYRPSLLPPALVDPLLRLDRGLQVVANLVAIRALLSWTRS
jgi:SAM-dependent methyltransferase